MSEIVGVARVRWELPFALRLKPGRQMVWEESMGMCAIDLVPSIGSVTWARTCSFLPREQIYRELGPMHDPHTLPNYDYLFAAVDSVGNELPLCRFIPGAAGGFEEAIPYTVANTYVCLTRMNEGDELMLERATKALNNLVRTYKAVTLDPWVRELDPARDTYMTVQSIGKLPHPSAANVKEALDRVGEIDFPTDLGGGRSNRMGFPSTRIAEVAQSLREPALDQVYELSKTRLSLDLLHLLVLSAIDHLSHGRHHLAVADAQTAFEVAVEQLLRQAWKASGKSEQEIDALLSGDVESLARRLEHLDRAARELNEAAGAPTTASFLGSQAEADWRRHLYRLRRRVVHAGFRDLGFDEARTAVRAGLMAMRSAFALHSSFEPEVWWDEQMLELSYLRPAQTPLSRMML